MSRGPAHVCGISQFVSVAQHIAPERQQEVQVLALDVVEDAARDGEVVDADVQRDDVGLLDVVEVLLPDGGETGLVDGAVVVCGRDSPADGDVADVVVTEEVTKVGGAQADVSVLIGVLRAEGFAHVFRVGTGDDRPFGFPLGVLHKTGQGIAGGDGVAEDRIDDFAISVVVVLRVRRFLGRREGRDGGATDEHHHGQ